ncbi:MAG: hypothetical protein K6T65_14405 [Peptococcaceae bacterium]|nr:hypothetical protein [Peptococcaceae bacterium]
MGNTLFTVTGCTRCKIVKNFMNDRSIAYIEKDMKAEGKEDFQKFYAANRKAIYRGPEGIEFPVFLDGAEIRQGIGAVIAYLQAGKDLDGFFSVGTLHKEWVDGIHVSSGNPAYAEEFLAVLRFLKNVNMKLKVDTNGKNSRILRQILEEGLASLTVMEVAGPRGLYGRILGEAVDISEVEESIALTARFPRYQFRTTVAPVERPDGEVSYLTPEEVAATAGMIEEITGSKKQPYKIRLFRRGKEADDRLKALDPMPAEALFGYRSAARVHQVFTEIDNE